MNMKNLMPQPSTYIDSKFHYIVTPLIYWFLPSELVQHCDISIHVVEIVAVGWVLILAPVLREGSLQVKLDMLCLRFIIHGIKPTHLKTDG